MCYSGSPQTLVRHRTASPPASLGTSDGDLARRSLGSPGVLSEHLPAPGRPLSSAPCPPPPALLKAVLPLPGQPSLSTTSSELREHDGCLYAAVQVPAVPTEPELTPGSGAPVATTLRSSLRYTHSLPQEPAKPLRILRRLLPRRRSDTSQANSPPTQSLC